MSKIRRREATHQEIKQRIEELRPFAPYASEQECTELAALLALHGSSLARVDGAAFGLAITLNASPEAVVPLLELDKALSPDEQERVAAYAQAIGQRVDNEEGEDLSVNPALLPRAADVREWLIGLGWGLRIVPEKMVLLMGDLVESVLDGAARRAAMIVMSFMEEVVLDQAPTHVLADVRSIRQEILGSMEQAPPEIRAQTLQMMLQDLFKGFVLVNMMSHIGLDSDALGPSLSFFNKPAPIRREGRKIGPNEPCPCGSGKKYKKCHGAPGSKPLPLGQEHS